MLITGAAVGRMQDRPLSWQMILKLRATAWHESGTRWQPRILPAWEASLTFKSCDLTWVSGLIVEHQFGGLISVPPIYFGWGWVLNAERVPRVQLFAEFQKKSDRKTSTT